MKERQVFWLKCFQGQSKFNERESHIGADLEDVDIGLSYKEIS